MNREKMMIMGSGATEGIPDPFCSCDICNSGRKVRDKEIRSRSCFRGGHKTPIDFGPDQLYQSIVLGNDRTTLENLLITNTHDDHYCFSELGLKEMVLVLLGRFRLNGNKRVLTTGNTGVDKEYRMY